MWIKILKYAGKTAISLGLHKKAIDFIRKRIDKRIEKLESKIVDMDYAIDEAAKIEDELWVKSIKQ